MESPSNPTPKANDNPRPNPSISSIDGFSRPTQPPATNSGASPTAPSTNSSNESSGADASTNGTPATPPAPALSAPVISDASDQKRSKMWTTILIVLVLLVFVGGLYGVYAYQQNKIKKLNTQVSSLTTANSSLSSEVNNLKNEPSVSLNNQPSSNSVQTLFKLTGPGVSFSVPATLSDLTYVGNSSNTTANLSTQNLATLDPACTATATVAPLGTITKTNGQYSTSSNSSTTLVKQYPAYYIAYVKPAKACSSVTQVNNLVNSLVTDFKSTFSTIQLITG